MKPFFSTLPLAFSERPFRREPGTATPDSDIHSDIYAAPPEERAATVKAALDAGITLFHAHYEREAQSLGESLRRLGIHDEVTISTTDGDVLDRCPDTEAGAREAVLGAVARKRQLLGLDVLDVFSLFDVRPDVHTPARLAGARSALGEAQAAGQIVRVGATCDSAFDFLVDTIAADTLALDVVMARFCFPHQEAAARLLPLCRTRGITTVAAHTFSWFGGVPFVRFPNTWRYRNLTKNFYGFTAAQAHLHWVLRQPNIDGALVSMQTPAMVSENAAATQTVKEPDGIESLFESFVDAITKTKEGWRGLLTDEMWEYRAAAESRLSRKDRARS